MNVVYTFDDSYSEITAVSMVSLLKNNKHIPEMELYIIDCGISEKNKQILRDLAQNYNRNVKYIPMIDLQSKIAVKLHTSHWSDVCYIRLFFQEMLPDLDRVLHIDCDTIVCADVGNIYNMDLKNCICGACYDCSPCPKLSAGINKKQPYYSNGFLLFDLKKMRDENLETDFIKCIEEHNGMFPHLDQDIINLVLKDRVCLLPAEYNVMSNTFAFGEDSAELFDTAEPYYTKEELKNAVKNPVIVHLVGYRFYSRPWGQPCYHPYNDKWIKYYRMTSYGNEGKILAYKKKKYGFAREAACWLWNAAHKSKILYKMQFFFEKRNVENKKRNILRNIE